MFSRRFSGALLTTLMMLFSAPLLADYTLNMTQGVTSVSNKVYDLHMITMTICTVIGIVVYGIMIWSIIRHRHAKGAKAATFHESTIVEIIWTLIPFVILLGMAVPATYTLLYMENTKDSDLSIKITGYRWYWQYDYVHDGVSFYSYLSTPEDQIKNIAPKGEHYLLEVDKPLVLPVGKKIRFLVTASDVIHSWWVPQLGVKKDAIPGFINEIWTQIDKPGIYRGQCAELCGMQHGFMPIVVEAKTQADYDAWLLAQKKSSESVATHDMTKS